MKNYFLKILLLIILVIIDCYSQYDSSKYYGSSYDGSSVSSVSSIGFNGLSIDITKFKGGSLDGFSRFNIIPLGLNGIILDTGKYTGGSFDGFAVNYLSLTGLGGLSSDFTKYRGGSFDGFSVFGLLPTGLNGENIELTKFKGGSYDGFSLFGLNSTGLGGVELSSSRYLGGVYDGYASIYINQSGLGGVINDYAKFRGGSHDGFAVLSTVLIPLNGGGLKLKLGTLIEGFYNPATNIQIRDTMMVYLRIASPAPFYIIDSAVTVPDSLGYVTLQFNKVQSGSYYIVIKHRNSIETWSRQGGEILSSGGIINVYDFTLSQNMAFGNNMILRGTRYCIYSGDVNRDGVIDGTDLSLIDNDVSGFATGYIQSDITGDMVTDGSDLSITDNNVSGFISVIKPDGSADIIKKNNSSIKKNKNLK